MPPTRRRPQSPPDEAAEALSFATAEEREQIAALLRELGDSAPGTGADNRVCKTIAEAAAALGVDPRTFSRWQAMPGFPGKPGTRGRASACYPLAEIQAWRTERFGGRSGDSPECDEMAQRKRNAEAGLKELRFHKVASGLIPRRDAEAIFQQTVAKAQVLLTALPSEIAASIPAKFPRLRRTVALIARRHVRRVLDALAGNVLAQDEQDEQDEAEEV